MLIGKERKGVFYSRRCFTLQKIQSVSMTCSFIFNTQRNIFPACIVSLLNQKITLIDPKISKTQVQKWTADHGGEWRTPSTIEIIYALIHLQGSDILNSSITSKPRLHARFGSAFLKYAFSFSPPKVVIKFKAIQGHTLVHAGRLKLTYRHTFGDRYHI